MVSNDKSICQNCGSKLKRYDKVSRIVRTKGGKTSWIEIERFRCPVCGQIHTVFLCFRLEIIIFQDTSKERRIIMRNFLAVVSYTLAAMSGICFAGGIAILSTGKGH